MGPVWVLGASKLELSAGQQLLRTSGPSLQPQDLDLQVLNRELSQTTEARKLSVPPLPSEEGLYHFTVTGSREKGFG